MASKKKSTTFLVISIAIFAAMVFYAAYAFFAGDSLNTFFDANVAFDGSYSFIATQEGQLDMEITASDMLKKNVNTTEPFVSGNVNILINLNSANDLETTSCTYDIVWEYQNDTYTVADKTLGANEKEFSVKIEKGNKTLLPEKDLSKFNWTTSEGKTRSIIYQGKTTANSLTSGTEERLKVTANVYNINTNQLNIINKDFTSKIILENINCRTINTETLLNSKTIAKIYGNSVQNGTPTPDSPIKIESVGDKTKNLIDYNSLQRGIIDSTTGIFTPKSQNHFCTDFIPVTSGVRYSMLIAGSYKNSKNRYYDNNKNYLGTTDGGNSFTLNRVGETSFIISDATYVRFEFDETTSENIKNGAMFYEGQGNINIEPYGKYKIPVTAKTNNLFDKTKSTKGAYIDELGVQRSSSQTNLSDFIEVEPSSSYKLILDNLGSHTKRVHFFDDNKNWIKQDSAKNCSAINTYTININTTAQTKYIRFSYAMVDENIIVGKSSITQYEPYFNQTNIYLDEPLRKIGDYVDYLDIEHSKVIRNVMGYSLKNRNWAEQTGSYRFYYTTNGVLSGVSALAKDQKSNYFVIKTIDETVDSGIGLQVIPSGILRVRPDLSIYDTKEKWKAFVDTKDIYAYYQLATPIEENVTLPEGIAEIIVSSANVLTTIQPSNIEYKAMDFYIN